MAEQAVGDDRAERDLAVLGHADACLAEVIVPAAEAAEAGLLRQDRASHVVVVAGEIEHLGLVDGEAAGDDIVGLVAEALDEGVGVGQGGLVEVDAAEFDDDLGGVGDVFEHQEVGVGLDEADADDGAGGVAGPLLQSGAAEGDERLEVVAEGSEFVLAGVGQRGLKGGGLPVGFLPGDPHTGLPGVIGEQESGRLGEERPRRGQHPEEHRCANL